MDLKDIAGFTLDGLDRRNVILGKNGCGKSHLLKQLETGLRRLSDTGLVRYITPERAGFVEYMPNIEHNMMSNKEWMELSRRKNQSENFKHQSAVLYKTLETEILREIDQDRSLPKFSKTIDQINLLLDRVKIEPRGIPFTIVDKKTGKETTAKDISSGESELISLAIEILVFSMQRDKGKNSFLLMDEPDVHLHPDLQYRLAEFIASVLNEEKIFVILATHSTALVHGLGADGHGRVAFMQERSTSLSFNPITEAYSEILPIFGAHPLSNVYKEKPILLVEGEDDARVWQQAVRSSRGLIALHPCSVDSVNKLAEYECDTNNILTAVYDNAIGFSIRDRDASSETIDDLARVKRMRLSCRAAENLFLTDDVLESAETEWSHLEGQVNKWVSDERNATHRYAREMGKFVADGFDRKGADLKEIRNIIWGMLSNKPWEVAVGQAIARLKQGDGKVGQTSLRDFLGQKVCEEVLHLTPIL